MIKWGVMEFNRFFEAWSRVVSGTQRRWRWVGYGLTALAFLYLAILIFFSREQIQQIQWQVYWLPFLLSMLIYLGSLLVQFLVWARMISFHHRISWRDITIYSRVLLMRRLPGGVWHWVDRTAMYTGATNVPGRVIMLANFLEWSLLLLLAIAIALSGWPGALVWLRWLAGLPLLLSLYLAYSWQPNQRNTITRLAESILWLALYSIAWMAGGLILYLFARATQLGVNLTTGAYQPLTYPYSIWSWAIAGGSSFLLVFIPAGLGVREITLTWLLMPNLPLSGIILVAILIRLTYVLADMVWGSLGMFFSLRVFKVNDTEIPSAEGYEPSRK